MNNLYLGSRNNINYLKHFKHEKKSKNYIINIYTSKSLHEEGVFDMNRVYERSPDDRVGKYCACILP